MILGKGPASKVCLDTLRTIGIPASHRVSLSSPMDYSGGYYTLIRNGQTLKALSIIITPADASEADQIMNRINAGGSRSAAAYRSGQMESTRPGLFFCDPDLDPGLAGRAVVARCRGWMGRIQDYPKRESGRVDPNRCRMCYTCMDICDTGAPQAITRGADRHVWIDPAICTGCGACAVSCPSNAICADGAEDMTLVTMLEDMLSPGRLGHGA